MRQRPFMQVDVFSPTPYLGNPLAVVLDGAELTDAEMQRFARWTNLSETTFLLPPTQPGADYRVRIFTPGGELPFAGHPTLGSCHAWLAAGGQPRQGRVVQECTKGLVPLRVGAAGALAFAAPPSLRSPITEAQLAPVLRALGLERGDVRACQQLDNGPNFWALLLAGPDRLPAVQPDLSALHALGVEVGLAALCPPPAQPGLEVRVFFRTGATMREDPITGSFNASLAQWLLHEGRIQAPYRASQGAALGMEGLVQVEQEGATVWIGGHVATCVRGEVWL
ncbi:PhzF family phenazine biosynthesis protein [Alicycliphilus sp. T452]